MLRKLFVGGFAAVASMLLAAAPVLAHGDHDARALAREVKAGPHRISLWQVYPDVAAGMYPHLIVLFDGEATRPASDVQVAVDGRPTMVMPSTTTANGWETMEGVAEGQVLTVTISDGGQTWSLDPLVVPPPTLSILPMQELIYGSIFMTFCSAVWLARRTARAWRRPPLGAT
jgi:hypothetical protein